MRFTFKTTRTAAGSYQVTVRRNGELLFTRVAPTRAEALHNAKLDAEAYGWLDE